MRAAALVDLDGYEHRVFPLESVNDVISKVRAERDGGFFNYVVAVGAN